MKPFYLEILTIAYLKKQNRFSQLLQLNGFKQLINSPTRETQNTESLIDHIYVNSEHKISQSGVIKSGLSDHYITFCTRKITRNIIGKHTNVKLRQMKNYTKEIFVNKLKEFDWSIVTNILDDVNLALDTFNTMFIEAIDYIAPTKEMRIKGRTETWIDTEILEAIRDRDKALYFSNKDKSNKELRKVFNEKRNKVTNLTKKAKSNHLNNKVEENKNNTKKLWEQLKTLGYSNKCKEKAQIILNINNEKCFDPFKIVKEISTYFLTIATNLVNKIPKVAKRFDVDSNLFKNYYKDKGVIPKSFKLANVSEEYIFKQLNSLNPSKATGIDGIKAIFLKDGADVIKGADTHIINLSLETNIVPNLLGD